MSSTIKLLSLVGLMALSLLSSGCGTAANLFIDTKIPYGGTLADGGIVVASVKGVADRVGGEPPQHDFLYAPVLAPLALIDLPFSFVADTLALPYTIPAHLPQRAARRA